MQRAVLKSAASDMLCGACLGQAEDGRKPPRLFAWVHARQVAEMKAPGSSHLTAALTAATKARAIIVSGTMVCRNCSSGNPETRRRLVGIFA